MRPPPTKPTGPATRPPATAPTAVWVARPAAFAAEVAATTAATAATTANPPSVLIEIILATLAIRQADQDTWPEFGTRARRWAVPLGSNAAMSRRRPSTVMLGPMLSGSL